MLPDEQTRDYQQPTPRRRRYLEDDEPVEQESADPRPGTQRGSVRLPQGIPPRNGERRGDHEPPAEPDQDQHARPSSRS